MLFELDAETEGLTPVPFKHFGNEEKLEKDLENLIASNMLDTLFGNVTLLPFFQERQRQEEADIYALNRSGDLVLFELKRGGAGQGAVEQLLRYATTAGQWKYSRIAKLYRDYSNSDVDLRTAHQDAFGISEPLPADQFNTKQHLLVVGNSANKRLRSAVEHWRSVGLSIHFLPYRLYELQGSLYFEFSGWPFDDHENPGRRKGVLFDTNRSYDEGALEDMILNRRVAAYGSRKGAVRSLRKGDFVFLYHKGFGLVAGAQISGNRIKEGHSGDELYWDVDLLTAPPKDFTNPKAMPVAEINRITGKSFFWARIQKVPYLNVQESERLLGELKEFLSAEV